MIVALISLLLFFLSLMYYKWKLWLSRGLPGPKGYWVIGSIWELREGSHVGLRWMMDVAEELRAQGHSIVSFNIFSRIYTIPITESAARSLLESHAVNRKGRDYDFIRPWLGQGLITS
ncbi:hypothetical protein PFISCL1PPCAC_26647, partial [Pristionchus fissidentatus]